MKTNLWNNWSRIAIEHERQAIEARRRLKRVWHQRGASRDILSEMHPSMVTIVAVSNAIDALHADIAPQVGRSPDPRRGPKRRRQWRYMLESFAAGLAQADGWEPEMEWLFDLRDQAVHFQGGSEPVVPHPELPTSVAIENVAFAMESAVRACDLLMRILEAMFAGGAPTGSALRVWGDARGHVYGEIASLRA